MIELYHGGAVEVSNPDLEHSRRAVDFGPGFYVTPIFEQAKRWSEKRKRRMGTAVVSRYEFDESAAVNLKMLCFESYSEEWLDFAPSGLATINLPGVGIWKIRLNLEYKYISYELIEGTLKEKKVINANPTKVVVAGTEREYTKDEEAPEGYEFKKNDKEEPIYGFPWDNQFCIKANRSLTAGETITVSFNYKASKPAKVGTQIGGADLGGWMGGEALGDIEFTTEEQPFTKTFNATAGMQTITFNMAVVKEAITYEIYDIIWKLEDGTESLIDETGSKNFNVKVAAGNFEQLGGETAIQNVVAAKKAVPAGKFNIAGQRVSDNYKGVVVEGGRIYLSK